MTPAQKYTGLTCFIRNTDREARELAVARLLELGFEGFAETDEVLIAYIPEESFSFEKIKDLDIFVRAGIKLEYKVVEPKNWNAEWEKNFLPVVIAGKCLVRAPFHPPQDNFPFEIIIEPRMAFGTGHHPTTAMMAEYILNADLQGKYLFDMGCGSGILGILAVKKGAAKVEMADNDPVAVQNASENIGINNAMSAKVYLGSIEILDSRNPDIITANINKPALIEHMKSYYNALTIGGALIISGIIEHDTSGIINAATSEGFRLRSESSSGEWVMLTLEKPEYS